MVHPAVSRLMHKDDRQRRRAVRRLFDLDDPESLVGFVPLLGDDDPWFRGKAMEAIRKWLDESQGGLVKMLAYSEYSEQRVLAAKYAHFWSDEVTLLAQLSNDRDRSVRLAAWNSRLAASDEDIAVLIEMAMKNDDDEIRRVAVGKIGMVPEMNLGLLKMGLTDPSPRVVETAVKFVSRHPEFGEHSEIADLVIGIARGIGGPLRGAAVQVIAPNSLENSVIAELILELVEEESVILVSSLCSGLREIEWWMVEGLADRLVSTASDSLVARLLRGERSQKVVPIRDAILSDQNKSVVLKSRIVEDMIGRPVDDSTAIIVSFLAESEDESLSAISKILLAEIESATS